MFVPTKKIRSRSAAMRHWRRIAEEIHYRELSATRQAEAREEYFKIVIQPLLSSDRIGAEREIFEQMVANDSQHRNEPTPVVDFTARPQLSR